MVAVYPEEGVYLYALCQMRNTTANLTHTITTSTIHKRAPFWYALRQARNTKPTCLRHATSSLVLRSYTPCRSGWTREGTIPEEVTTCFIRHAPGRPGPIPSIRFIQHHSQLTVRELCVLPRNMIITSPKANTPNPVTLINIRSAFLHFSREFSFDALARYFSLFTHSDVPSATLPDSSPVSAGPSSSDLQRSCTPTSKTSVAPVQSRKRAIANLRQVPVL